MDTHRCCRSIAVVLVGSLLVSLGCQKRDDGAPRSPRKVVQPVVAIDRKTFSVQLPAGWTEDTKDDKYEPDSVVFFENPESCLFTVIVGKKSEGASLDGLLKDQKEGFQSALTEMKSTDFNQWGNYEGKGIEMEGKMQGQFLTRVRTFGFESTDHACVISESAFPDDFEKFATDFQRIRQSFRLK